MITYEYFLTPARSFRAQSVTDIPPNAIDRYAVAPGVGRVARIDANGLVVDAMFTSGIARGADPRAYIYDAEDGIIYATPRRRADG